MAPNRPREDGSGDNEKGPEKQGPISELQNIIRAAAGQALKPKAQKEIEAKVKGFSYRIQVAACVTPEDFITLFRLFGIQGSEWKSSAWLAKNGFQSLAIAIRKNERFLSHHAFINFMRGGKIQLIDESILELPYNEQISHCKTGDDFWNLFVLYGVKNEEWRSSYWLQKNGLGGFTQALTKSGRFKDWNAFMQFVGPTKIVLQLDESILKKNAVEQIKACKQASDFLQLFSLYGISEGDFSFSALSNKGLRTVAKAIVKDERFGSWEIFIAYFRSHYPIQIDAQLLKRRYAEQIEACQTSDDFRGLFELHGILGEEWRELGYFSKRKLNGLRDAIKNSSRFSSWSAFLTFMGPAKVLINQDLLRFSHYLQVKACKTPDDFRALFSLHGFVDEEWRNTSVLSDRGLNSIYQAIRKRPEFPNWEAFLTFMGPEKALIFDKKILARPYTEQVSACKTIENFLQLFQWHGISETWNSSSWLLRNNFQGIYTAIRHDSRFSTWESFLQFMDPMKGTILDPSLLKRTYPEQVASCKTVDDFRLLFTLHKIDGNIWRNSLSLQRKGHKSLYRAIFADIRFGSWENFLNFMDGRDEESVDNTIEKLDLTEAIALLGATPSKLKLYIKIAYPELAEKDIDTIVGTLFKRLTVRKSFDYSTFKPGLGPITFESRSFPETSEPVYLITGHAPGADSVIVSGSREIRVRTNPDGSFRVRVPLRIGELNEITLVPVNHTDKTIGPDISISVQQTSKPDDIEALVKLLDAMGKSVLDDIRQDPGRFNYVVQQTEQVLIRKFSKNFEEGRNYVEGLIATMKSPAVKKVLKKVLDNFRRIDRTTYPNVKKDSPLYFFQKYCIAEIQRRIERGDAGVILANAPGLGKTRTALVAINGDPATIIAPNSVVSAWGEEADKCLIDSNVLTLRNLHSKKRIEKLQKNNGTHVVTNVEFLRAHPDDPRYALLANEETIIVQDEAHGLANLASEQSKGARRLNGKFQLLLSATPFKDPRMMRRMFHHLYPLDVRFSSDKAFSKAFPAHDHEALRTLSILKDQFVIRFRKEDVLEEMDPTIPVADQKHRLPKKEHIPLEKHGAFTMTMKQAEATYELFKDWGKWTKKYDKYVPKDEIAKMDGLRGNQFTFGKLHALRQIANNPEYVGEKGVEDPKATQMKRAVEKCLKQGRKVVIFCQYNAQAEKYAELLKKYAPSLYTGVTSKEGNMKNPVGKEMLFKKHEKGGWEMDAKGYPVADPDGTPMLAMDYERITYQDTQDRKVMIATYSAGAVGVTFTAGKAVIFDDLPRDCTEEIQAEDRTHRIDHEHQTHHTVTYIKMASAYPKAFLDLMKKKWVKKKSDGTYEETMNGKYAKKHGYETAYTEFFEQGTWDQVKIGNLQAQRNMFDLLNDGIIDKAEATKDEKPFSVNVDS